MLVRWVSVAIALGIATLVAPRPSAAAFHFANINEIMTSYGGDATKQFVEIRMLAGSQTVTTNSVLAAFDASGTYISDVLVVPGNLSNGMSGATWIMATSSFIGVTPDFTFPSGIIPTAGGMICWGAPGGVPPAPGSWDHTVPNSYVDCVAYGTYSGPTNSHMSAPTTLDAVGHSLRRTVAGTNDALVFVCTDPATPTNNAGSAGSLAATTGCPPPPTATPTAIPATPTATSVPPSALPAAPPSGYLGLAVLLLIGGMLVVMWRAQMGHSEQKDVSLKND